MGFYIEKKKLISKFPAFLPVMTFLKLVQVITTIILRELEIFNYQRTGNHEIHLFLKINPFIYIYICGPYSFGSNRAFSLLPD